jgi:L-lysine exporter family protein LysE/ArgO
VSSSLREKKVPAILAVSSGFLTGLTLIIAIGAQNAFVLRQGLRRDYIFMVVLFAALSDALLVFTGILGLGQLIVSVPYLLEILRFAGAAYLLWFAYGAVRRAIYPEVLVPGEKVVSSRWKVLATIAALTYLNPHVYIDTVLLLGTIGNQFGDDRLLFGLGAAVASFTWFFSLGYLATTLSAFVGNKMFWRVFESLVAVVMIGIALTLIFNPLK